METCMTDHAPPRADDATPTLPVTLHVCLTCRIPGAEPEAEGAPRAGRLLHDALAAAMADDPAVRVVGVECLSNCSRGCTVALSGAGRWTYVVGALDPAVSPEAVRDGALRYAAAPDGLVPWRERPEAFRKGVVARVPAL
jgi:predicted metal-binding protein